MWNPEDDDRALKHLFSWMRASTMGCSFAQSLASSKEREIMGICLPGVFESPKNTVQRLDRILLAANQEKKPVLIAFPSVENNEGACALINLLSSGNRWNVAEFEAGLKDSLAVGITWETPGNKKSRVMGLGPSASMPPVRRAPYFSIALWPGDHENIHWGKKGNFVSLIDAKLPEKMEEKSTYDNLFTKSTDSTDSLMTGEFRQLKAKDWVKIAFLLPEEWKSKIAFSPSL